MSGQRIASIVAALAGLAGAAAAQPTVYTGEAAFLAAARAAGATVIHESFDGAAWDGVRTPPGGPARTAPQVTSLGLTWSASDAVTTVSSGRTQWAVCDQPGGDPDVLFVASSTRLIAFGGWFMTSTAPANVLVLLDGRTAAAEAPVSVDYAFLGVVDPAGFTGVELRETEGAPGDTKHVFLDDVSFGTTSVPPPTPTPTPPPPTPTPTPTPTATPTPTPTATATPQPTPRATRQIRRRLLRVPATPVPPL